MQKYQGDENAPEFPDPYAEIARLKETVKVTQQNNTLNQEDHRAEADLLKAEIATLQSAAASRLYDFGTDSDVAKRLHEHDESERLLKAALKRAESAMHDHHMHGRTVDFAAAIAEARELLQ